MSEYVWSLENIQIKPNSREGRTAKLVCHKNGELIGWCFIEGWLYGCALMGLSSIASLPWDVKAFPSFKKFLAETHCTFGQGYYGDLKAYLPRRFMFTAGAYCTNSGCTKLMVEESQLVTEFENWTHQSAPNKMYFFNLKDKV